jgi:hypothetical protein
VTIRLLAEAEAELDEAVAQYEALSAGLGAEFAADIRIGFALIEEYPDGWQLLGRRVRRYCLRRFPFGLVYDAPQLALRTTLVLSPTAIPC